MDIFINKVDFSIRRIEKLENGWNFYPSEKSEKPIFISKEKYAGEMPKKFKSFWQCWQIWKIWQNRKLVLNKYKDFILSAELDGVLLFETEEKDYPEELQKKIAYVKQKEQEYLQKCKAEDEQLNIDLTNYLQAVPVNANLEDDLSKLRIPLRVYLKLHFFKGTPSVDSQARLTLMFMLAQMAERIYKRHVKETDKKYFLDLSCYFAVLKFEALQFGDWPNYHFDMKNMENAVGTDEAHKTYEIYYEAENLINEQLPPCQENVKRYLNYVVLNLLFQYAEDWDDLQSHFMRNGWSCERINSDEQDYLYRYEKMKLLHYTNFILPEQIPQDKMDDFVKHFNLS